MLGGKYIVVLLLVILDCVAGGQSDWDHHLIACHTSDYICFKRQYKWLRDHALLGNQGLGVPDYEPYEFVYSAGTCVRISGVEDSELVGISIDSNLQEYFITLALPLKIQQVKENHLCEKPKHDFNSSQFYGSQLHTFTGNATVYAKFPYLLKRENRTTRLELLPEDLDVALDIADLSQFRTGSYEEEQQYYSSEWAYNAVQNFDAAEAIFAPYMDNLRRALDTPLKKYIHLYPDEEYASLMFSYDDDSYRREMCRNV